MMRASLFEYTDLLYSEEAQVAQDYDLWTRLVRRTQLTNLPDTLLQLRRWGENITSVRADEQADVGINSSFLLHKKYVGADANHRAVRFFRHQQHAYAGWAYERGSYSASDLSSISKYLLDLLQAFLDYHDWPDEQVQSIKSDAFGKLCDIARVVGQHHSKLTEWRLKARALTIKPEQIPQWIVGGLRRKLPS